MQASKIDAIISAWRNEGDILPYSRIKWHLVNKGIIRETNDRSLSRWLKNLVEDGILEKTKKGYILKMKPKAYQVFDYLNELRQKFEDKIYEGEVGGFFSHICAMTYLNFDETLLQEIDERIAFDIISVRLAELFSALYLLKNTVLKRRVGLNQIDLADETVRETFFGLLIESISRHNATENIVKRFSNSLREPEKKRFREVWKKNRPKTGKESLNEHIWDFFLDSIQGNVKRSRKQLKKTAGINIDRYDIEQLIEKYIEIQKWIEKNHEKELLERHGYSYTKEESELEATYRRAILIKVIEGIQALNTNFEDFAVILTRHPATMNQYYTAEHILYNAMEWAKKPPEDEFSKEIWIEDKEKEKTFEGMVAERLINTGRLSVEEYSKLRSKPWVIRELKKFGDFDLILKIYSKKLKNYFKGLKKDTLKFVNAGT